MSMADTQHFCLRWNNYQSSITSAFENLRDDEDFVDVTLACDGKSLKAHRVVLSACSPYFRELLKSTPCKHPVIVLQDVAFADLHALVEFIYHGEVNVHQRNLSSFLKTAEVLRVSGLTQQAEDRDEFPAQLQGSRGHQHSFSDKLVEDALFTSPPSPPPPPSQHSNATSSGATVNQLLRRAAAAAAIASSSSRRERHNSAEQQSDSSEQSQHSTPSKRARTSANVENSNHNNGETTSVSTNQVTATDFSSSPFSSKQTQGSTTGSNNRKTESDGNVASGDGDSSPSPTSGMLDGVKSEPLELLCGAADMDNSNDSVEATGGDAPGASHQQSLSAGDHDDHDSIQGHPGSVYLSTPESKLFASTTSTGSFNFSMAALAADPTGLSGIGNQSIQGNTDASAGTSSQAVHAADNASTMQDVDVKVIGKGSFTPPQGLETPKQAVYNVHQDVEGYVWGQRGGYFGLQDANSTPVVCGGGNFQEPYCSICRKSFSRIWSLQRHIDDIHGDNVGRPFVCNICQRVYSSRSSLISHKSQFHALLKNRNKTLTN